MEKVVDKGRYIVYNKQADEVRDNTNRERRAEAESFQGTLKETQKTF